MSCVVFLGWGAADQGTLITVLTMVTEALSDRTRPLMVVRLDAPAVEIAAPDWLMMVPTIVPPPPALMTAALPTCQNTFLACAPFARITLDGKAAPGPPTVSVVAIWKIQAAFASPCASSVRSPPWIMKEPGAEV